VLLVAFKPAHGSPHVVVVAMFAILAAGFVLSVIRFRQRGPAISGWIPPRWRQRVNTFYARHGWEQPYDEDGSRRTT
jgi:hypothetical protein